MICTVLKKIPEIYVKSLHSKFRNKNLTVNVRWPNQPKKTLFDSKILMAAKFFFKILVINRHLFISHVVFSELKVLCTGNIKRLTFICHFPTSAAEMPPKAIIIDIGYVLRSILQSVAADTTILK